MDHQKRFAQAQAVHAAGLHRVKTTPPPAGQKYPPGTRVRIADPYMIHFINATVEYTYAHAYGGDDVKSYSLHIDGHGSTSWYQEGQLQPI